MNDYVEQLMSLADSITAGMASTSGSSSAASSTASTSASRPGAPSSSSSAGGGAKRGKLGAVEKASSSSSSSSPSSFDRTKHYKVPQPEGQQRSRQCTRDLEAQRFNSKFGWVEDDIALANRSTSMVAKLHIDGFTLSFARDTLPKADAVGGAFMNGYDIQPVLNLSLIHI